MALFFVFPPDFPRIRDNYKDEVGMKNPAVKLLLVDDNSDNLFLLETLLKSDDVEVVLARSGVEALDQLKVTRLLLPCSMSICRTWMASNSLSGCVPTRTSGELTHSNSRRAPNVTS